MKEVWEKQYDKNKPPWNYDYFDKDLSEFFRNFDILSSKFLQHYFTFIVARFTWRHCYLYLIVCFQSNNDKKLNEMQFEAFE